MIERSAQTMDVSPISLAHRDEVSGGPSVPSSERFVSLGWLASYWSVSIRTVQRDIRKGALRAFRLPGGDCRVRLSDAIRYGRPIE